MGIGGQDIDLLQGLVEQQIGGGGEVNIRIGIAVGSRATKDVVKEIMQLQ